MAFALISAARHSLHPTRTSGTSNDAAGFAFMLRTAQFLPLEGLSTLGSDPPFPPTPPACLGEVRLSVVGYET